MRIKLFCSRSIHLSRSHLTPFMMNVALRLGIHLACLVLLQAEEQTCSDSAPAPGAALLQAQPRKIKQVNVLVKENRIRAHTISHVWFKLARLPVLLALTGMFIERVHFRAILVSSVWVITQFCVSVVIPTRPGMNSLG